jgi:hypothetical protein
LATTRWWLVAYLVLICKQMGHWLAEPRAINDLVRSRERHETVLNVR